MTIKIIRKAFLLSLFVVSLSFSQTNKECLECHSEKTMTMEKHGKTISTYVDEKAFAASKHADISCTDCHTGYDPGNIPHKENPEKINCLTCHESRGIENSVHGKNINKKRDIECYECHSPHTIQSAKNLYTDVDLCLKCHNESDITGYKNTAHYKISGNKRNASCNNCHGVIHKILPRTNPASSVYSNKVLNLCLKCHSENQLVNANPMHKSIFASKDNNVKNCSNCHGAHSITMEKKSTSSANCLKCHLTEDWFKNKYKGANPAIISFVEKNVHSVHSRISVNGKEAASCPDCHGDHTANTKLDPRAATSRAKQSETCGRCHPNQKSDYDNSDHGKSFKEGFKGAPVCSDCHGEHGIVAITDSRSPVGRKEQIKVCLNCHVNNPDVQARVAPSSKFISSYEMSAHGLASKNGNTNAAVCSDCHGGHKVLKGSDPLSSVNIRQIPKTCSKCHAKIETEYKESIHGQALAKGNFQAPVCTSCHGEHDILTTNDPRSPIASANVSSKICENCHNSVSLNSKFGLASGRIRSYKDSYHGLATTAGDTKAANCASCHGVHNIKPSSDPTSTISKANLAKTCGQCHPGANENFTKGAVHVTISEEKEGILYIISSTYIVLIIMIVGGMFVHNLFDFLRKSKSKFQKRRYQSIEHRYGTGLYLRMSVSERIQHVSLMLSFIVLVLTGFMLKFPNAWWVVPFRNTVPGFVEVRSVLHRIAAVVMVSASLFHLYYIFFNKRGKELLRDLLPKIKDVHDALGVLKYNFGFAKVKPKLDRFSYIEKAEYWALVWGTVVMSITGSILWFENYFLGYTSKLFTDISLSVHYYEAWLAALSILVWHIYFVIFNPDVYPMNLSWIRGTLTEEEMADEHPLELERLKQRVLDIDTAIDSDNGKTKDENSEIKDKTDELNDNNQN
jgi:formate dehydrogenase gamma subunit